MSQRFSRRRRRSRNRHSSAFAPNTKAVRVDDTHSKERDAAIGVFPGGTREHVQSSSSRAHILTAGDAPGDAHTIGDNVSLQHDEPPLHVNAVGDTVACNDENIHDEVDTCDTDNEQCVDGGGNGRSCVGMDVENTEHTGREAREDVEQSDANESDEGWDSAEDTTEVARTVALARKRDSVYIDRETELLGTHPNVLWALLQLNGARRLTNVQYTSVRKVLHTSLGIDSTKWRDRSGRMPHLGTITGAIREEVISTMAVPASRFNVGVNLRARGARNTHTGIADAARDSTGVCAIDYVSPMQYAIADFGCTQYMDAMHALGANAVGSVRSLCGSAEHSPLVQSREWFYGEPCHIDVDSEDVSTPTSFAEASDTVVVKCVEGDIRLDGTTWGRGVEAGIIRGVIAHVFLVRHADDESPIDDDIHESDETTMRIVRKLRTMKYEWSGSGLERDAIPMLQPSDIVAVIAPTESCDDRVLLVHRFVRSQGERTRFVIHVSATSRLHSLQDIPRAADIGGMLTYITSENEYRADVYNVQLLVEHAGCRGPSKRTVAPCLGELSTGEKYGVYRFALYMDGFQMHTGSMSTAEGIYIQPLCIHENARKSTSSARVLCVVPPGGNASEVIRRFIHDLVKGMTRGRRVVDARGITRRVFLDCVAIFGDTPGLNKYMDVRGHRAKACCHRCTFDVRDFTPLVNGYIGDYGTWNRAAWRRTAVRHNAVRLMKTSDDMLTLLGVSKEHDTTTRVLYDMRTAIRRACREVPRIAQGTRVVPCVFDPFAACTIEPDHLICGHAGDILYLAYMSFEDVAHRIAFERTLLCVARDAHLCTQNALFKHDKHKLLSMSMSDMYALIPAMPLAYRLCATRFGMSLDTANHYQRICHTLESLAMFVASLWQTRVFVRLGESNVSVRKEWYERRSTAYEKHMRHVKAMCTLSYEDSHRMLDDDGKLLPSNTLTLYQRLSKECVQVLACANTHRMRELFVQSSLMWFHDMWIGELTLERTHRRIKQVMVSHTYRRREHILAMNAIRMDDWATRLRACLQRDVDDILVDTRGAIRFLAGHRWCISELHDIPVSFGPQVARLLAPDGPVAYELFVQHPVAPFTPCDEACERRLCEDRKCRSSAWASGSTRAVLEALFIRHGVRKTRTGQWRVTGAVSVKCKCRRQHTSFREGDFMPMVRAGASMYTLVRAVAFARLSDDDSRYVAFVQNAEDVTRSQLQVQTHEDWHDTMPYRIVKVRRNDIHCVRLQARMPIWRGMHACDKNRCGIAETGAIRHTSTGECDTYVVLTWFSGFPSRCG